MNNPTIIGKATLHNMDCMDLLKATPDKFYDLAIVDPPYGINVSKTGNVGGNKLAKAKDYGAKEWDAFSPDSEYFLELQRVSKNQVVWGANHFMEKINKGSPCWIVWDKDNSGNFADCELAFTSFKTAARLFKYTWNGMLQGDMKNKESRIHPTQKPVKLYEWLLTNYATPGDKILDTHLGSGSHAIACNNLGFDLTACELDKDYFEASVKRIKQASAQERLFA
jgi:site-specific DNA-methyltransferase (adenine-specific)